MLSEIYGLLSEKEGYEVREGRETYNYAGNCIISCSLMNQAKDEMVQLPFGGKKKKDMIKFTCQFVSF